MVKIKLGDKVKFCGTNFIVAVIDYPGQRVYCYPAKDKYNGEELCDLYMPHVTLIKKRRKK